MASGTEATLTPHPDPPPQGGRENCRSKNVAAADVDHFASDIACLVRREKGDNRGNIGRLARAAQWDLGQLLLPDRIRDAARHGRVDEARAEGVDRDLRAPPSLRRRAAQTDAAPPGA